MLTQSAVTVHLLNDLIISNGINKNVFGTVCGDEVRVKEMKSIEEMRKTLRDKLEKSIETAVQVMSVTKPINMFR